VSRRLYEAHEPSGRFTANDDAYFNVKPHGKLDLVVEAFNLLNRTNVLEINAVYGQLLSPRPAFGRPIKAGIARQIQFSVDFEF